MSEIKQNQPNQNQNPKDKDAQKHQQQGSFRPGQDPQSSVGKDTDNDGRVVKPGHKPGEVDGDEQRRRQQQHGG